jgi:hypothetical protein
MLERTTMDGKQMILVTKFNIPFWNEEFESAL